MAFSHFPSTKSIELQPKRQIKWQICDDGARAHTQSLPYPTTAQSESESGTIPNSDGIAPTGHRRHKGGSFHTDDIESISIDTHSDEDDTATANSEITDHAQDHSESAEPEEWSLTAEEQQVYGLKNMDRADTPRFCAPYTSLKEMLDDEAIIKLLTVPLSRSALNIFGDLNDIRLPDDLFHLERDLRKITVSLQDLTSSIQRKYGKLVILKHYDTLITVYHKYCEIGGDSHWLNHFGWSALMADIGLSDNPGPGGTRSVDAFYESYDYHHIHSHSRRHDKIPSFSIQLSTLYGVESFHDKDPWTGIWMLQSDRKQILRRDLKYQNSMDFNHYDHNTEYGLEIDEYVINGKERHFHRAASSAMEQVINGKATQFQQFDSYKMRKVGDLKVAGCLVRNNRDTAVLDGTLRARNYRKASMEMTFRRRRKHKNCSGSMALTEIELSDRMLQLKQDGRGRTQSWKCELVPPRTMVDPITMRVKWEEHGDDGQRKGYGTLKLFKYAALEDDDQHLPSKEYVGLARCEFSDAILSVSRRMESEENGDLNELDLFEAADRLVVERLYPLIANSNAVFADADPLYYHEQEPGASVIIADPVTE